MKYALKRSIPAMQIICLWPTGLVQGSVRKPWILPGIKGLKQDYSGRSHCIPILISGLKNWRSRVKLILSVELNSGQMVEDVRLAVNGKVPVEFYGRMGGMMPTPEEIVHHAETLIQYHHAN